MCADPNRPFLSEPYEDSGVVVDLRPGQRLLDRFTIRQFLGRGGTSSVFSCWDEILAMEVALKVAPVASEVAAEQVRREVRLNSKITDYSHVVRLFDVHLAECEGTLLLLVSMEYAEGGSLRRWLIENREDLARRRSEGVQLVLQACEGVQALHDAGIVHRDVKPENLLLVGGVLKVSDLSISRHIRDMSSVAATGHRGGAVSFAGTPAYMSPEQFVAAHPDDIDGRSDIYSLGAVLFEMCHLHCRPPFGGSCEQLRERHLHMAPPVLEGLAGNLARVISRCLQKRPQDRYQTVGQMLEDWEARTEVTPACLAPIDPQIQVDRQAESLWRQAVESVTAARLMEAGRLCRRILGLCPEHEDAQRVLEEIQCRDQQARQFYAKIERGVGYQSLEELLALLQEVICLYPDHPEGRMVQTQLLSLTRQYDQVMQAVAASLDAGQWEIAQANLERARQINPGSPAIARLCVFVNEVRLRIETMRNGIDAAVEQGQREKALFLARGLDDYIRRMSRPESRPQEWRTTHENGNILLNLYRFARELCANVFGGARPADRE